MQICGDRNESISSKLENISERKNKVGETVDKWNTHIYAGVQNYME